MLIEEMKCNSLRAFYVFYSNLLDFFRTRYGKINKNTFNEEDLWFMIDFYYYDLNAHIVFEFDKNEKSIEVSFVVHVMTTTHMIFYESVEKEINDIYDEIIDRNTGELKGK